MLQTRLLLAWCSLYLISLCTVSGINLEITPRNVVLLSQSPPQTTFRCSKSVSESGIAKVYEISLSKIDQYGDEQIFATADGGAVFKTDTAPNSLKKTTIADVSGGIDTSVPASSTLNVAFETDEMVCADAGMYKCTWNYKKTADNKVYEMVNQANLSVHVLPSEVMLAAQKGGMGVVGTLQMPYEMNVNESIQFTCNGKIGSEESNWLRYKMSSQLIANTFNMYTLNVNQGEPSTVPVDCSYTSSSTMTYVVQALDAEREHYLAFKCYVSDQPPNQGPVTQESKVFYIKVIGGNSGNGGNPGGITGGESSSAGTIIAAVFGSLIFVTILVILAVYFVKFHKGSCVLGASYRTKEDTGPDNPNIAPSTDDLYAKPAKDKNRDGNDNGGVDEDYNYRDADDYRGRSRGRENRAMDNDSYNSRDGSPTMHMGSGHIGTGV